MAITTIAEPQSFTPAYNPIYWYFDSTLKANLGFRYVVSVIRTLDNAVIGTYKLKPIPTTLYGEVDVSKLIQGQLYNDFQELTSYTPLGHQTLFELGVDEEYFYNIAFTDYAFAGSISWANFSNASINPNGFSRTMLVHGATLPLYVAGDVIQVTQTPSVNYRPELDGIHTVLDVFLSGGLYYTVLDLLWIGDGAASAGNSTYADGQKITVTGITTATKTAYKGAFKFMDFKNYIDTVYQFSVITSEFLSTLPDGFRISRNKPTWLSGYLTLATMYVEFNISGTRYRYPITGINSVKNFNILPATAIITEVWNGSAWVAFVGTINLSNVETYTVRISDGTDYKSKEKTITLYSECDQFTTYDITFLDRLGSWITVPFSKGSYMTQNVERSNIRTKYGGYDSGAWVYDGTDKGEQTYHVEEVITYNVNTGILSEVESQYMRELLSTPQAYVSINGEDFQAISIKSASIPLHLKRTQRDRKVNLQFTMSVQDEING